jgi:hypothetical protein
MTLLGGALAGTLALGGHGPLALLKDKDNSITKNISFFSKKDKIITDAEEIILKNYLPNLEDPSSYKKISTVITRITYDNNGKPSIYHIEHKYKALNSFGLLSPDKLHLTYHTNSKTYTFGSKNYTNTNYQ